MYAYADRLGIEELKEYACTYFVDIAGDKEIMLYDLPYYGELLTLVYENTIIERTWIEEQEPGPTVRATSGLRYAPTMCAVRNLSTKLW